VNEKLSRELEPALRAGFDRICARYPQKRAALLPILHLVQDREGFLSRESLVQVAEYLEIPPVEVLGVVTFYPMFRREPGGRHRVAVCRNISCHLLGARSILQAIEKRFGVQPGETTEDGRFTLESVQCQGACGYAPMLTLDGEYHENLTPEGAVELLEGLE